MTKIFNEVFFSNDMLISNIVIIVCILFHVCNLSDIHHFCNPFCCSSFDKQSSMIKSGDGFLEYSCEVQNLSI